MTLDAEHLRSSEFNTELVTSVHTVRFGSILNSAESLLFLVTPHRSNDLAGGTRMLSRLVSWQREDGAHRTDPVGVSDAKGEI